MFSVCSPVGVSEGDVVLLCPACKHLFLCNEAVVVSSPAALALYVSDTFIRPPGFVVVIGNLLGSRFFSGKQDTSLYIVFAATFLCDL